MPSYLLIHERFVDQYLAFQIEHPKAAAALQTALKKIVADPVSASGAVTLHGIPDDDLAGNIFRLWIRGSSGFRLIWVVDRTTSVACPVFVSPDRRDFDWDTDIEWLTLAIEIHQDMLAGNEDKFMKLLPV